MNWYLAALKKYAEFKGRSRRMEFWMFALFYWIGVVVLMVVEGFIGLAGILSGLFALGHLVPNIAVTIRRLHDTDRSGWWLLIVLVPAIGFIVLLVFMCMDGTAGANRFGPNPKEAAA